MKVTLFWCLTLGVAALALVPLAAWILSWKVSDSFGLGLLISARAGGGLLFWALAEIRRDPQLSEKEREAVRRSVFFTRRWRRFDMLQPWMYLHDRVRGRNTRVWLRV